ncbi:MAG TPA: hypothetical protein VFL76_10775 [Edaphocola sp.]|nr:hypothetical protein [Edaphocola sp.]
MFRQPGKGLQALRDDAGWQFLSRQELPAWNVRYSEWSGIKPTRT